MIKRIFCPVHKRFAFLFKVVNILLVEAPPSRTLASMRKRNHTLEVLRWRLQTCAYEALLFGYLTLIGKRVSSRGSSDWPSWQSHSSLGNNAFIGRNNSSWRLAAHQASRCFRSLGWRFFGLIHIHFHYLVASDPVRHARRRPLFRVKSKVSNDIVCRWQLRQIFDSIKRKRWIISTLLISEAGSDLLSSLCLLSRQLVGSLH